MEEEMIEYSLDDIDISDEDIVRDEYVPENDDYFLVDKACPKCQRFALEKDTLGYEEVIFCRLCDYSRTRNIE
ncbi:MAG TPA: hypothetical protein V6C58_15500 [Allocoleopsis sp.]